MQIKKAVNHPFNDLTCKGEENQLQCFKCPPFCMLALLRLFLFESDLCPFLLFSSEEEHGGMTRAEIYAQCTSFIIFTLPLLPLMGNDTFAN